MTHPEPPRRPAPPPAENPGQPGTPSAENPWRPGTPPAENPCQVAAQQPAPAAVARAAVQARPAAPPAAPFTAAPRPRRQAAAAAPPVPPNPPPESDHRDRTGPSGRTTRLHIGWHSLPRGSGPGRVTTAPATRAGLLLGRNRPIPLLAADPTRIALVGGLWAARLLIFRAFALGARAIVVTTDPRAWSGFGERATGQHHRLTVLSNDQGGLPPGTPQTPTLILYDLSDAVPTIAPALGPWHSSITLLRRLDRTGLPTLQEAGLTLLQRLDDDETTLAAAALRLPAPDARLLTSLADDMVALFGGGADDYVPLSPTPIEQQLLGPARR